MCSLGAHAAERADEEGSRTPPPPLPPAALQILEHRRSMQAGGHSSGGGGGGGNDALSYRQFLQQFVPSFCRASNNLLDLQVGRGWAGWWRG